MNIQTFDVSALDAVSRDGAAQDRSPRADCDASMCAAVYGRNRTRPPGRSLLSERECRILLEISRGASNKQVARLLDISPSTVRTHVESLFRKLECSTRAAATMKGSTLGLIS